MRMTYASSLAILRVALWLPFVLSVPLVPPAAASEEHPPSASSIYELAPLVDGAVTGASMLAIAVPYLFSSHLLTPTCPCRSESVNAFDRGVIGNSSVAADWVSTVTVGLTLVGPPVIDSIVLASAGAFDGNFVVDFVVFAEAVALNGALTTAAKYTFQRPIPRVYSESGAAADPNNYRSFYSGHTSTAFAALSVASVTANRRYGLTWQPWAVTAAVGASVAIERIAAGRHFYSDVIVGAAMGTAVGSVVGWLHLRDRGFRVAPWAPGGGSGLTIAGSF